MSLLNVATLDRLRRLLNVATPSLTARASDTCFTVELSEAPGSMINWPRRRWMLALMGLSEGEVR